MAPESFPERGSDPLSPQYIEARKRELARLTADLEEVNREMNEERKSYPLADEIPRDPEFPEFWNEMTSEEQAEWMRNLKIKINEHRDEISKIPGGGNLIKRLDGIKKHQETLARLEDQAEDMILQTYADEADVSTRLSMAMIEMVRYLENLTEEQWQEMPAAGRGNAMDLLNDWNNGEREEVLSQLPIEIRRRYE